MEKISLLDKKRNNVRGLLIEFWADREVLKIVDQSISCPLRPFGSSAMVLLRAE